MNTLTPEHTTRITVMTRNGLRTMRNRVDRVLIVSDNASIEWFDCGTQSTLIRFHCKTRELRARVYHQ